MITPTEHEKNEWSRMAKAAYAADVNWVGHKYSMAATVRNGEAVEVRWFDAIQEGYRAWLIDGKFPTIVDGSFIGEVL